MHNLTRTDQPIDSLRGVAVVLMVAGHVIGGTSSEGMTVADDSVWRLFYIALEDVRMPLFTVLSGFVYAMRPVSRGTFNSMILGKSRRLLVPLLTVGTIFLTTQTWVSGTNSDVPITELWRVPLYGYGHFWFALALFIIFAIMGALDRSGALRSPTGWAVAIIASSSAFVIVDPSGFGLFSMNGAIRLLPFFLLGYGLRRYPADLDKRRPAILACATLLTAFYAANTAIRVLDVELAGVADRAIKVAIGITATYLLLAARGLLTQRHLAWLGQFSFSIYLLHVFGAAASRMALQIVGVEQNWVVFAAGLVVAIAGPVAFETTAGRVTWISWTFLGQKPWRPNGPKKLTHAGDWKSPKESRSDGLMS